MNVPGRMPTRWLGFLAILVAGAADLQAAPDLTGVVSAEHIWDDNVFGSRTAPADRIVEGQAGASCALSAHLRTAASGRLVRFRDNASLDHEHASVSATGIWAGAGSRFQTTAGLLASLRANEDLYAVYDYRDVEAFVAQRYRPRPATLAEARIEFSARHYPDWQTEDARAAWLRLRLNRSLPSRTSVGLHAALGWKVRDQALDATMSPPTSARWEATLRVAQSLSRTAALRGWITHSRSWRYPDVSTRLAAFENPLLDAFSTTGTSAGIAFKYFRPGSWWIETTGEVRARTFVGLPPGIYDVASAAYLVDDSGSMLLAAGERTDTVLAARIDFGRPLLSPRAAAGVDLVATVAWTDQDSNDLYWVWRGWSANLGISVHLGSP